MCDKNVCSKYDVGKTNFLVWCVFVEFLFQHLRRTYGIPHVFSIQPQYQFVVCHLHFQTHYLFRRVQVIHFRRVQVLNLNLSLRRVLNHSLSLTKTYLELHYYRVSTSNRDTLIFKLNQVFFEKKTCYTPVEKTHDFPCKYTAKWWESRPISVWWVNPVCE